MIQPERILLAAQGYLELGMYRESLREVGLLSMRLQDSSEALEIKALGLMGIRAWQEGLEVAQRLKRIAPDEAGGYIHSAYCLHELGQTREALDLLLQGPEALKTRAVFFYNVACYQTRLGELDAAWKMLQKAFDMDASLRQSAKRDPDLEAIKSKLGR